MAALYAILFSYIVETINHRLYPGDEAIKKLQRENGGASIVMLDVPGFQTKSPNGGLIGAATRDSSGSMRRNTLIQAYGEDGYDQFVTNYSNELLQHWLTRRAFNDDATDLAKRCVADGIKLPEVDALDGSAMTLELLRGGLIGSRADSKPGGMLGGLSKTCSNFRKGKVATEEAADSSFLEGMEERFATHSRYIPRVAGVPTSFAVKHYAGIVSYTGRQFVENDSDLLDSEFVRLFRSASSEAFLSKLFSGPSLAAESHPRDPSVLVAAQVSSQPLRRLSPLKVSRSSSTSVPAYALEPDIQPVTNQLNDTLTGTLAALNEVPVWTVSCVRPNDSALPGIFDVRRVKTQLEAIDVASLMSRKRVEYMEGFEFANFRKRYASLGCSEGSSGEEISSFLEERGLQKGRNFAVGQTSIWLSFVGFKQLEGTLRGAEVAEQQASRRDAQVADAQRVLEANAEKANTMLGPTMTRDTTLTGLDGDQNVGFYGKVQMTCSNMAAHRVRSILYLTTAALLPRNLASCDKVRCLSQIRSIAVCRVGQAMSGVLTLRATTIPQISQLAQVSPNKRTRRVQQVPRKRLRYRKYRRAQHVVSGSSSFGV
jgi:chitin synthase